MYCVKLCSKCKTAVHKKLICYSWNGNFICDKGYYVAAQLSAVVCEFLVLNQSVSVGDITLLKCYIDFILAHTCISLKKYNVFLRIMIKVVGKNKKNSFYCLYPRLYHFISKLFSRDIKKFI